VTAWERIKHLNMLPIATDPLLGNARQ
jgi:hypothetical protein